MIMSGVKWARILLDELHPGWKVSDQEPWIIYLLDIEERYGDFRRAHFVAESGKYHIPETGPDAYLSWPKYLKKMDVEEAKYVISQIVREIYNSKFIYDATMFFSGDHWRHNEILDEPVVINGMDFEGAHDKFWESCRLFKYYVSVKWGNDSVVPGEPIDLVTLAAGMWGERKSMEFVSEKVYELCYSEYF
ncbi:MAG: hypothetical protein Alpg2KO_06510 [Alphaproteobacteria bacterium]